MLKQILVNYYESDFYKIMDLLEFVSMRFKMEYMKNSLEYFDERCESPAEMLLYDSIVRKTGKRPIVQMNWSCSNGKQYRLDSVYRSTIAPVLFTIEVDGRIYHECRILKDKLRDKALLKDNIITIRVNGKFIYKDPDAAAQEVLTKIKQYHTEYKTKNISLSPIQKAINSHNLKFSSFE